MDTLIFLLTKGASFALRVDSWIVFGAAATTFFIFCNRLRAAKWCSIVTTIFIFTLATVPIGNTPLARIEAIYPSNPALGHIDGIIVLGGGEDRLATARWRQPQLGDGGERLMTGVLLARRFPNAQLLFTGGSGAIRDVNGASVTEASVAAAFFDLHGVEPGRRILEDRSRNTFENARLGLLQAQPKAGETWVLITSAAHMPRAMKNFEKAGWKGLQAYPVDYRSTYFSDSVGWDLPHNIRVLNAAILENLGLIVGR